MGSSQKKELFRRFPDTSDLPNDSAAVQHALIEQLAIVWADIGENTMNA